MKLLKSLTRYAAKTTYALIILINATAAGVFIANFLSTAESDNPREAPASIYEIRCASGKET